MISQQSIHPRTTSFIIAIMPLVLLVLIVPLQMRYDHLRYTASYSLTPEHRYVLPAALVSHFTFGFKNFLADYYWISVVQDVNKWDGKDVFYPEYFRIIAALDPHFAYPYIFAALTVPSKSEPASLAWLSAITERGMAALPDRWEIPFYTGLAYHSIGKDNDRASAYLATADAVAAAPEVVHTAYALFLLHSASDYQRSRALFNAIYETTDNDETKRIAKEHIILLDFIEAIDRASLTYKAAHHVYPSTLNDLIRGGFIVVPPEIGMRFPIVIDKETGKASLRASTGIVSAEAPE